MTELTRQDVLDFMAANPKATTKREIARGLGVTGKARSELRTILQSLEADGALERTAKRAWSPSDRPPPTGLVLFTRVDQHGDLVGKALGSEGPYGPDIVYVGTSGKRTMRPPGPGDKALCKIHETPDGFRARMIKRLDGRNDPISVTGIFKRNNHGGVVTSTDKKDRREWLVEHNSMNGAEDGDLVVLRPKPRVRRKDHGPQRGKVVEIIGKANDPRAASRIAIHNHNIPVEFPAEVIADAKGAEPTDCKREDLTKIPLITIDPPDARDHDDAVWAEQLENGWRVIVAIADVAAYVRPGTALDREAWTRGNSTYFPDRVVPMLPEELSADACSLREKETRACMAVEMEFDTSGTKRRHRFLRGTMRSAAKLSYNDAQNAIDGLGGTGEPYLDTILKPLWGAYVALSKARDKRGPLDLDLPERRIEISPEGEVTGVTTRDRFDAHRLIEEFMIQANVCAAETLEAKRTPLLYRIHDQPTEAKLSALADMLKTMSIKWPLGQKPETHRFNRLLADHRDGPSAEVISDLVLRSQAQAVYDRDNIGHFGLNLSRYAHFTSPIRRYSDLVVHRALITALKLGPDGLTDEAASRLEETAEHLSTTERRSMAAERDASDRYLALFLADRVGAEFRGRITGVTSAGLFVRLEETSADGFIPVSKLSDEYWIYDDKSQALIAEGSGRRFDMGMSVNVRLAEATPLTGGLLLDMLSRPNPKRPGQKTPTRGRGGPSRGRLRKGGRRRR